MPVYTYTTFDDPLASGGDGTHAAGINDTGQIVGTYDDASGVHGFLLSGGSYTTLDAPLAQQYTIAQGINGAGQIVGVYFSNNFGHAGLHGFLYNKGVYTTLDHPLATDGTEAVGINAKGEIVGVYGDSAGNVHGFLLSGGSYTTLDDPLAAHRTLALGIDDKGRIVGSYDNASGTHGFLLQRRQLHHARRSLGHQRHGGLWLQQ
jgi:probable HAF family extracellular repeat protein